MTFTIDEKTIIKMYSGCQLNRDDVLASIQQSLPFVEEKEIAELMSAVIRKINTMTAEAFEGIDLSNALEN